MHTPDESREDVTRDPTPSGALALVAAAAADSAAHPDSGPKRWSGSWWSGLLAQLVKFGLIGGIGFVIDIALFNLLRITVFAPEVTTWGPMAAKVVSTCAAILFNWAGNRFWTFREHRSANSAREGIEFFAVSLAGMLIGLIPLGITHYGIGLTTVLWDNIANIVGIGLGSIFRFVLYRWWVYAPSRAHRAATTGTADTV